MNWALVHKSTGGKDICTRLHLLVPCESYYEAIHRRWARLFQATCFICSQKDRDCVRLSSLPQRIFKRLCNSATSTRPKAKHYLRKINHMTISNRAGCLALWKLQLDDPIQLVEPGLNPPWLLQTRVRNNTPTDFTILKQPFHGPLVDPVSSPNEPGSTLREEWRQMLLK